ncbi:MFS transporter [Cohnella cholangitidis]|uniref:MFS transporter n=1 Tax=Cohnella cholangitidis TaxID=2598458 RepID=A0A7G5BSD3_9BACL|nr:MFS transporter [Cohnella cholangitidis]QMV39867.1 MFS transporter [Cohnella cholangitidis]
MSGISNELSATETANPLRWKALFLLCLAQFMVIMDTSIIGVALPAIKEALGYSQSNLQWVFNAYVIFFGGLLLLGGRLSDLFGQRKMFNLGFMILSAASLLAGLAWSEEAMNVGRGLQGLGSALIAPSALTIIMQLFIANPKELNKAFGFWGASAAAGGTAGVFLGGVITEWLSWNWTFLINIPVGLFAVLYSLRVLPKGTISKGSVDLLGALTVTASLVLAVYAIVTSEHSGWGTRTFVLLAVAVLLFLLFLIVQMKKQDPLVPLGIFKAPKLLAGNLILAALAGAWIPLWFFLNLYLQQVLRYSAFKGGLALVPMTILIMILMVGVMGKLVGKFGLKGPLVIGMIVLSGSLLLFAVNTPEGGNFATNVLPASLLGALGMALAYIPATIASVSGANSEQSGLASGLSNTSYQIGSAIGLAIMVAVSSQWTKEKLDRGLEQTAALNIGFHSAFIGAAIIAIVGALIAIFMIRKEKKAG